MSLKSQEVRAIAPEMDPLRMGMGWKVSDLSKPQVMVESSYGDSHPGSAHLNIFVEEAVKAVNENGGKAARYFATDMCDGIAQGHDGINYSLAHRDAITNLIEAQANATVFDGGVFIASCDKSMPAMLMSIGRLKDMSAIVVTGGVMEAALRSAAYLITGENPDFSACDTTAATPETPWMSRELAIGDATVRIAVASGLENTSKLLDALESGEAAFDFVEIMACPGGCVGGGGQPIRFNSELAQTRAGVLNRLDAADKLRYSHENPDIAKLYADWIGEPLSHTAHEWLHTDQESWKI